MSPIIRVTNQGELGFPRASGDEPENPSNTIGTTKFSPRERG